MTYAVVLHGGSPWGFRIQGGAEYSQPIRIATVNPNSKAANAGLRGGDHVDSINGARTEGLLHNEALKLIRNANDSLSVQLTSGKKPSSFTIPEIRINGPPPSSSSELNAENLSYFNSLSKPSAPAPLLGGAGGGVSYQSDGEMSASSDSQSSIIHVADGGRKTPSQAPSSMWSPSGSKSTKSYKPVTFNVTSSHKSHQTHPSPSKSSEPSQSTSFPSSPKSISSPTKSSSSPLSPATSSLPKSFSLSSAKSSPLISSHGEPRTVNQPASGQQSTGGSDGPRRSAPGTPRSAPGTPRSAPSTPITSAKTNQAPPIAEVRTNAVSPTDWEPRKAFSSHTPKPSSGFPVRSQSRAPILKQSDRTVSPQKTSLTPSVSPQRPGTPKPQMYSSFAPSFNPSPPKKFGPAPSNKSKGMALFLNMKERHAAIDEEGGASPGGEGYTVEEGAVDNAKEAVTAASPVVGRATPIPIKNDQPAEPEPAASHKSELTLAGAHSPDVTVASVSATNVTSPTVKSGGSISSLSLLDQALEDRRREREAERMASWAARASGHPDKRQFPATMETKQGTSQTTTSSSASQAATTDAHREWNGSISHFAETRSGLPQPQSATVTLLQRNREERRQAQERANQQHPAQSLIDKIEREREKTSRPISPVPNGAVLPGTVARSTEDQIPEGAIMMGQRETVDGNKTHTDTFYMVPGEQTITTQPPREIKAPPKLHGVGPKDADTGVPLTLRKSVDEDSQKDWYRNMYKSLHRAEPKRKEENPYSPSYSFPEYKSDKDREEPNPYLPSYEYPADRYGESRTMTLDRYSAAGDKAKSWSPPHAKYRTDKYKNQPRRIEDYEPGRSSLAQREAHLSKVHNPPIERPGAHSRYVESDTEVEFVKKDRPSSPARSDITSHQLYRSAQRGGDIPTTGFGFPHHARKGYDDGFDYCTDTEAMAAPSSSYRSSRKLTLSSRDAPDSPRRPTYERSISAVGRLGDTSPHVQSARDRERSYATTPTPTSTGGYRYSISDTHKAAERKRREEDAAKQRRLDMERLHAQQKERQTRKPNSYIPEQRSPIALNRYDDASSLQRPVIKKQTMIRGKARAKHSFKAQSPKELSFHKGDTLYLLRKVDNNWYEGEHHGHVGIFPINYVQVLVSLDDARTAAILREGQAIAKFNLNPQSPKELPLKKGESVNLVRRVDDHWYEGRSHNDKQGIFPVNYVEVLREPDAPLPTPASSFAPSPRTASPGAMSPSGSIAPTVPSAPLSPRSTMSDMLDLETFNFDLDPAQMTSPLSTRSYNSSLMTASLPNYHRDLTHTTTSKQRSSSASGSADRTVSSQYPRSSSTTPYTSHVTSSPSLSPRHNMEVPTRDRPLSPYMERTLKTPSSSSSYGPPKHDSLTKPFEQPSYPPFRAMYNYQPQNKDELALQEGDVVYVIEKCDDGWYVGTSQRTKDIGTFPGNYVHKL